MGGVSERSEFADDRAAGSRVATMSSASAVNPNKNKSRHLEYVFGLFDGTGTSCPRNITLVKSDIEEPIWN